MNMWYSTQKNQVKFGSWCLFCLHSTCKQLVVAAMYCVCLCKCCRIAVLVRENSAIVGRHAHDDGWHRTPSDKSKGAAGPMPPLFTNYLLHAARIL
jgi:hypothetical protein